MIGLDPDLVWRCQDGVASIDRQAARAASSASSADDRPPLESLRALIAESALPLGDELPPMAAGLFGYLGYDMVRQMERLPEPNPDVLKVPDAILVRPTVMVVFDAVRDEISLDHAGAAAGRRRGEGRLRDARWRASKRSPGRSSGPFPSRTAPIPRAIDFEPPVSNTTPEEFDAMVATREGVHPRRRHLPGGAVAALRDRPSRCPAFALYRSLRRVNPAPFLCYLDFEDFQIVCSSPEILVRVRDGKVTIRPDRRHPPARRDRGRGPRPCGEPARRPEGAGRAPDAARSRPQRRRPGRRDGLGRGHGFVLPRILQPGHAHRLERRGHASTTASTPSTPSWRAFRPARSRAPRRCAPWRSSTSWRRTSAAPMPAASAISAPTARWTPASCCAPPW